MAGAGAVSGDGIPGGGAADGAHPAGSGPAGSGPASVARTGGLLPPTRLEAFSDGVFAIAITLLVLELDVPEASEGLWGQLGSQWPSYVGYLVSFAFIGGVWMSHTTLTRFLKAADQVLLGLNLGLLLLVSFLPFTTSLMASHLGDASERLAVVAFGLNLTLASLMLTIVFRYAARTEGLADRAADRELAAFARQRRASVLVQGAATLLGLFLPSLAVVVYLAVSVLVLAAPIARAGRVRRAAAARASGRAGSGG